MKGRGVRIIDRTIKESSVFLGFGGGVSILFSGLLKRGIFLRLISSFSI